MTFFLFDFFPKVVKVTPTLYYLMEYYTNHIEASDVAFLNICLKLYEQYCVFCYVWLTVNLSYVSVTEQKMSEMFTKPQ